MLSHHSATESEKKCFSSWHYEGPFEIYNQIPYEEQLTRKIEFADPDNIFFAFYEGDELIGFAGLSEKTADVYTCLGVRPDKCGMGYGRKILLTMISEADKLFPGKRILLEVRTFNERAVRCYKAAGFTIDGNPYERMTPTGPGKFIKMVRTEANMQ